MDAIGLAVLLAASWTIAIDDDARHCGCVWSMGCYCYSEGCSCCATKHKADQLTWGGNVRRGN